MICQGHLGAGKSSPVTSEMRGSVQWGGFTRNDRGPEKDLLRDGRCLPVTLHPYLLFLGQMLCFCGKCSSPLKCLLQSLYFRHLFLRLMIPSLLTVLYRPAAFLRIGQWSSNVACLDWWVQNELHGESRAKTVALTCAVQFLCMLEGGGPAREPLRWITTKLLYPRPKWQMLPIPTSKIQRWERGLEDRGLTFSGDGVVVLKCHNRNGVCSEQYSSGTSSVLKVNPDVLLLGVFS